MRDGAFFRCTIHAFRSSKLGSTARFIRRENLHVKLTYILRSRLNFIRLVRLPGIEREYSWSFVPFHAGFGGLCPIEVLGNRH